MARTKQSARRSTCGCGCRQLRRIIRQNEKSKWMTAKHLAYRVAYLRADQMDYSLKYPIRLLRVFCDGRRYDVTFRAKGVSHITATYNARFHVEDSANSEHITINYFCMVDGSETPERKRKKTTTTQVPSSTSMSSVDGNGVKLEVSPSTGSASVSDVKFEFKPDIILASGGQIKNEKPNLPYVKKVELKEEVFKQEPTT